jgi:hypothetical protein
MAHWLIRVAPWLAFDVLAGHYPLASTAPSTASASTTDSVFAPPAGCTLCCVATRAGNAVCGTSAEVRAGDVHGQGRAG